jgi:hypothetical protein
MGYLSHPLSRKETSCTRDQGGRYKTQRRQGGTRTRDRDWPPPGSHTHTPPMLAPPLPLAPGHFASRGVGHKSQSWESPTIPHPCPKLLAPGDTYRLGNTMQLGSVYGIFHWSPHIKYTSSLQTFPPKRPSHRGSSRPFLISRPFMLPLLARASREAGAVHLLGQTRPTGGAGA